MKVIAMQGCGKEIRVKSEVDKRGYKTYDFKKNVQKQFNFGSFVWN